MLNLSVEVSTYLLTLSINVYKGLDQGILARMIKDVFPMAKFSAKTPATVTRDCTCLGHLGHCDTNRNDLICVVPPKVAKAST
jgi:hypothetical protein